MVVANKCDLEYERQVQPHEGRDLAKRFGAQCIETSAKQRVNVDDAFVGVVRAIRKSQKEEPNSPLAAPPQQGGTAAGRPAERSSQDEVSSGCCGGCVIL